MDRAIVTIVGGGAFVPKLCEAAARLESLPPIELRLVARRAERLAIIADHAARAVARLPGDVRVTPFDAPAPALLGARVVVLLIRVGGLAARAHDEAFPRPFGLAGDEGLGPGGVANAYRTAPVLAGVARTIREHAPGAAVLNLVAPLGVTTRLLLDEGTDAIGLCELPLVTLEALARAAGVAARDVQYRYAGLNHLGWFWDAHAGGVDVIARAAAAGLADARVIARFGAAPLPYYHDVVDPEAGRRLGRARAPDRALALAALSERLLERFARDPGGAAPELDERPTPWFERAVVPALRHALTGAPWRGFANVRNRGLLRGLPDDQVVETPITADRGGLHPRAPGAVPDPVERFLSAAAHAEDLSYRAARARSPALVAEAIRALPLPIAPEDVPALARLACAAVPDRD
jgi:6-phospho-beta-glucosidase